jgi:hypothetical protein
MSAAPRKEGRLTRDRRCVGAAGPAVEKFPLACSRTGPKTRARASGRASYGGWPEGGSGGRRRGRAEEGGRLGDRRREGGMIRGREGGIWR